LGTNYKYQLTYLEQAIGGYAGVALNATTGATLTFSNGALSDGKNQVLKLTGTITTNVDVIVPDSVEKTYVVENATSGAFTVTVKTTSGSGVTWGTTDKGKKLIYSDGTDILEGISSIDTLKVSTFTSTGIDDNATSTAITINSSEQVEFTAGTVSLPSISTTGDTNTGIFFPSADTIAFTEGGTEAMRINSNGNIGIGTTNSTLAKVYISHAGDVDDNGLYIESNIGQTVPLVKIIQDGAGSTAPAVYIRNDDADGIALHLYKGSSGVTPNSYANTLFIESSSNTGLTIASGTSSYSSIYFANSTDNDIARIEVVHSDNSMRFTNNASERMRITSTGNVGIGTTSPGTDFGKVLHISGASAATATTGGSRLFYTGTNASGNWSVYDGTAAAYRAVIDSSGNVGIGTSSPSSQSGDANTLVVGSGSGNKGLTIYSGTTSNGAIRFSDGTSGADTYRGQIDYDHNDNSLKFVTDTSERMRIDSSGNVGIGTTSPNSYAGQTALTINSSGVARVDLDVSDTIVGTLTGESTYVGLFSQGASTTLRLGTNNTERMRIDSSGNVGIGTSSPTARLSVADSKTGTEASPHLVILGNGYTGNHWLDTSAYYIGQNSNARLLRIYSGSNEAVGVELGVGATSFGTYSDERLKKDITDLTNGLNKILALRPVNFKYKSDADDYRNRIGIIAQSIVGQVDEALDETKITADDETQYYNVRYQDLIPVLVKGIQEQQTQIQELEAKITALETNQP
jgi:hypothetical protein